MEITVGSDPLNGSPFRLIVIDGELDHGGRLVCMNGTGDLPLFMYTIDPTQCVTEVVVPEVFATPTAFTTSPVPEPSTWALMLVCLAVGLWRSIRQGKPKPITERTLQESKPLNLPPATVAEHDLPPFRING